MLDFPKRENPKIFELHQAQPRAAFGARGRTGGGEKGVLKQI
jgi:hypothetical protein